MDVSPLSEIRCFLWLMQQSVFTPLKISNEAHGTYSGFSCVGLNILWIQLCTSEHTLDSAVYVWTYNWLLSFTFQLVSWPQVMPRCGPFLCYHDETTIWKIIVTTYFAVTVAALSCFSFSQRGYIVIPYTFLPKPPFKWPCLTTLWSDHSWRGIYYHYLANAIMMSLL